MSRASYTAKWFVVHWTARMLHLRVTKNLTPCPIDTFHVMTPHCHGHIEEQMNSIQHAIFNCVADSFKWHQAFQLVSMNSIESRSSASLFPTLDNIFFKMVYTIDRISTVMTYIWAIECLRFQFISKCPSKVKFMKNCGSVREKFQWNTNNAIGHWTINALVIYECVLPLRELKMFNFIVPFDSFLRFFAAFFFDHLFVSSLNLLISISVLFFLFCFVSFWIDCI